MDRTISRMSGHVIVCGWGRVGTSSQQYLRETGLQIVAVDRDPERLRGVVDPHVLGDVTDDAVLAAAGIDRAHALIAALDTDADNVFVTLSARALRPDLIIVSRVRNELSMSKLLRAGADRVVNPQLMCGRRMAAFALQPHVADFLDVVMHDEELDYRLEQMEIGPESPAGAHAAGDGIARTHRHTAARPPQTGRPVPGRPRSLDLDRARFGTDHAGHPRAAHRSPPARRVSGPAGRMARPSTRLTRHR